MRGLRRCALAICLVVLIEIAWAVTVLADDPYRTGYVSLTAPDDPPVPVSVWYPTEAPAASFAAGPYTIAATPSAPPAPGRHRLIVISHGSSGSDLGHHDLAESLARNGMVVAAPRHLGDSFDQPRAPARSN